MSQFDKRFWDKLISYIEDGQVVPIVGQELLTFMDEGRPTNIDRWLVRRLAESLNADGELAITLEQLPAEVSLSDIACAYKRFRSDRADVYLRLKQLLDSSKLPIPNALRQLAQISGFRLFVSTTFDCLLEQALNNERHGGRRLTTVHAYAPNDNRDLDVGFNWHDSTVLFQLMGRVSGSPSYAVTDEDVLEFMNSLLDSAKRPKRLLDELQKRHLLFLGNSFSDWLERFFLRSARYERLWKNRDNMEVVADGQVRMVGGLASFLNNFSQETRAFTEGSAVDFVQRLHEEWTKRHSTGTETPAVALNIPVISVFLSYASDDLEAARKIAAKLGAVGVDTWFDKQKLQSGETYNLTIQKAVSQALLFVPVISHNTEQRDDAYFRKEWHWARERLPDFTGTDRPFVLPVVLDQTNALQAKVPEEFRTLQWTHAPAGELPDDFPPRIRDLVRQIRKAQAVTS